MKPILRFTAPGKPVPKGRPRFVRVPRGQFVRAYTPERTLAFEERIAFYARKAAKKIPLPLDIPLCCRVRIFFPMPKKKRPVMDRRPDLENVVKAIWDGLEKGGIVKDDARFVELWCRKDYADEPRAEVEIFDLADFDDARVKEVLEMVK